MKIKIIILGILVIFISACAYNKFIPNFTSNDIIEKIKAHRISISVHYEMTEKEYLFRMKQYKTNPWKSWDKPILLKQDLSTRNVTVAYLGSGTILKDNFIISVNHLFDGERQNNTLSMNIWMLKEGMDHPVKCKLIVRTKCELTKISSNDYAIVEMEENLGLPGLKIAKPDSLKMGDKVIFSGSVGGLAFFSRFGYVTQLKNYFTKDAQGRLTLTSFENFPFWTIYPSGSGDSGGGVTNVKGELVTIMYCGITVSSEAYVFGNPTQMIWDFLKKYDMEYLGK